MSEKIQLAVMMFLGTFRFLNRIISIHVFIWFMKCTKIVKYINNDIFVNLKKLGFHKK